MASVAILERPNNAEELDPFTLEVLGTLSLLEGPDPDGTSAEDGPTNPEIDAFTMDVLDALGMLPSSAESKAQAISALVIAGTLLTGVGLNGKASRDEHSVFPNRSVRTEMPDKTSLYGKGPVSVGSKDATTPYSFVEAPRSIGSSTTATTAKTPNTNKRHTTSVPEFHPGELPDVFTTDFDVLIPSRKTVDELNIILVGTGFEGQGQVFYDLEQMKHVNALFAIAHALAETSRGFSAIYQEKNNAFGFDAVDTNPNEADAYDNLRASVMVYGDLLDLLYLQPPNNSGIRHRNTRIGGYYVGGTTIFHIFENYSTARQDEARLVVELMNENQAKLNRSN